MQFVLKNNEHRPDCVVILRGKNLCAQAENLVFHMTRGAVVQTILRREGTLPYIGYFWDTADRVRKDLGYCRTTVTISLRGLWVGYLPPEYQIDPGD
jgi:hypothetical protein